MNCIEYDDRKGKVKFCTIIAIIIVLMVATVVFFQFTSLGYRISTPYRNFSKVQANTYIENNYSGDKEEIIKIINEAKSRVSDFWGNVESNPMIIITDNQSTIAKLGGDHDTSTLALFHVYSFIVVSDKYLNTDVVAHELTHAELHSRIYKGKFLPRSLVPTWFDEGVALQNDYRDRYSDDAWAEIVNGESEIPSLDEMDTAGEFYAGDKDNRMFHYVISRHEVKRWLEKNGVDKLIELLDDVNDGESFNELY